MRRNATRTKTLEVPVSGSLGAFIEERVRSRGYGTESDYVRALIREDRARASREALEEKLAQAVERADYRDGDEAFWERLRERARGGDEWHGATE